MWPWWRSFIAYMKSCDQEDKDYYSTYVTLVCCWTGSREHWEMRRVGNAAAKRGDGSWGGIPSDISAVRVWSGSAAASAPQTLIGTDNWAPRVRFNKKKGKDCGDVETSVCLDRSGCLSLGASLSVQPVGRRLWALIASPLSPLLSLRAAASIRRFANPDSHWIPICLKPTTNARGSIIVYLN